MDGGGILFKLSLTFFFHFLRNSLRSFALTVFAQSVRIVAGSKVDMVGKGRGESRKGLGLRAPLRHTGGNPNKAASRGA